MVAVDRFNSVAARQIRTAISPRLAAKTLLNLHISTGLLARGDGFVHDCGFVSFVDMVDFDVVVIFYLLFWFVSSRSCI